MSSHTPFGTPRKVAFILVALMIGMTLLTGTAGSNAGGISASDPLPLSLSEKTVSRSLRQPPAAMTQTRTINLNTGYDQWLATPALIDVGKLDNEWRVAFDTTDQPPPPPPATGRPADVVADDTWINVNPSLAGNFPNSRWISIRPNQGQPLSSGPNKFQYVYYFSLPTGFWSPLLTMKLNADEHITKVTLNSTTLFQGSGGIFAGAPLAVSTNLTTVFNSGPTVNVLTVEVEDTGGGISGLIVDGTVTYEDCQRPAVKDIQGLESITFWESTFASPTQHPFSATGPELTNRLSGPLKTGNSDFESLPNLESYDVFYSDANGNFMLDGQFVTIEADLNAGAPSGGGLNLVRVDLKSSGQLRFANSVMSFVALGNNAMPNDVGKAVDFDPNVLTDTTMGNTIGQTQRLRVTVGFPCSCAPRPSDMVGWWPLDGLSSSGEYEDLIGGDNNGTPKGNPSQIPNEYVGNSLQAGTEKYVEVPDATNLNFGHESFTIDAWVKYTPGSHTEPIVYKLANQGGYFLYLSTSIFNGPVDRLYLQVGSQLYAGPQFSVPMGTWIFVAARISKSNFNTGTVDLYVGVPGSPLKIANHPAGAFTAASHGTPLQIGRWPFNPNANLGIDEVEIFSRPLSEQAEIQSIFEAGSVGKCKPTCLNPPPSGMVAWWPLEEKEGSQVVKELIGGHDGTPMGFNGAVTTIGASGPNPVKGFFIGDSLLFTGDYVEVPDSPTLNFGRDPFTIDAWVNYVAQQSNPIVSKLASPTGPGYFLSIEPGSGPDFNLTLQIDGMKYKGPTVPPSTWAFVAATRNASGVTLYVGYNNTLTQLMVMDSAENADSTGTPLRIGQRGSDDVHADTVIDEVEIFNRDLDEAEIDAIFSADWAGKCKPAPCPALDINPASLVHKTWTTDVNYPTANLTATGGTGPYAFTLIDGALPSGMVMDPDGTLHGKPVAPGTYDFTVRADDANGCAGVREYQIVIATCPSITINPAELPAGTNGAAYSQTITATGGCSPHSFSVPSGTLPPGLTLASNGTLSGTPTLGGTFTFTVKATDNCGCTGERSYVFKIDCGDLGKPYTYRAGNVDEFASPNEPSTASLTLQLAFSNLTKNFDDPTINRFVEHTFTTLPANIVKAELEVRMRPEESQSFNDSINLFTQSSATVTWGIRMEDLPPSQNPSSSWIPGDHPRTFIFDLANLPPSGSNPTDLIAMLAANRYLDIVIQDDTTVDYMKLRVWTCPKRSYVFGVPTGPFEVGQSNGLTASLSGPLCLGLGTALELAVSGQVGDVGMEAQLMFKENPTTGLIDITAVFPAFYDCYIPFILDSNGTGIGSDPCISPTMVLASVPPGTCIKEVAYISFNDINSGFSILFDSDTDITIPGRAPLAGRRLNVIPQIITDIGRFGKTILSTFEIRTTGISSFTLGGVKVQNFGLFHHALGDARFEPFGGNLAVTNLGSSGADGVTFDLPKVQSLEFGFDPIDIDGIAAAGSIIKAIATGSRNGVPNQTLGILDVTKNAANYLLSADFSAIGSTSQRVQLFNNNALVLDLPGHTGPVGTSSAWLRKLGQIGNGFTADFDSGTTFVIDGTTYPGNHLRVIPEGVSGVIDFMSAFTLKASGIDEFTLTSAAVDACPAVIDVNPATIPGGTAGTVYPSTQFTASAGTAPFTFNASGNLPPGLVLDPDGTLHGTPVSQGTFNFNVTAADVNGCLGVREYQIVISCPAITLSPAAVALLPAVINTPHSQTFTAAGGCASSFIFSLTSGALPSGLTLGPNGVLSGTATQTGNFTFTLTASDSCGCSQSQTYTLTVVCPTPPPSAALRISEFRFNGPNGSTDEFFEIFNDSPTDHEVGATALSQQGGYGLFASAGNGVTSNTVILVCRIPNGTIIPARGYVLCTGGGYSLASLGAVGSSTGSSTTPTIDGAVATAAGNFPIINGTAANPGIYTSADVPNDAGLLLANVGEQTIGASPDSGTCTFGFGATGVLQRDFIVFDRVGFAPYGSGAPLQPCHLINAAECGVSGSARPSLADNFCESTSAQCSRPVGDASTTNHGSGVFYGDSGQYSLLRRQTVLSVDGTVPQDTGNNADDILMVSPLPGKNIAFNITNFPTGLTDGVVSVLGAAGPQNNAAPPDLAELQLQSSLFDSTRSFGQPPNAERSYLIDTTTTTMENNPLGTYILRFGFRNTSTTTDITRLRFRVDNLSVPCGQASPPAGTGVVGSGNARNLSRTSPNCQGSDAATAVLKMLNLATALVSLQNGPAEIVRGSVIEDIDGTQLAPNGGGINTSLVRTGTTQGDLTGEFTTVVPAGGPGPRFFIGFRMGVVKGGRFRFLFQPEGSSN